MRAVCPCEFCALMFAEYCEGRGGGRLGREGGGRGKIRERGRGRLGREGGGRGKIRERGRGEGED